MVSIQGMAWKEWNGKEIKYNSTILQRENTKYQQMKVNSNLQLK